jgi:NAD(P)-dependent dehydrogenase (short-subunit alcohol dehydrogenase family)
MHCRHLSTVGVASFDDSGIADRLKRLSAAESIATGEITMSGTLKMVLVGGAGGIGQSVCSLLADQGGEAFLIGRQAESLEPLAGRFGWGYQVADASDWDQLQVAVKAAEQFLGGFQAAVNLAGSVLLKPAHLTTRSDWDKTLAQNLTTAFGLLRATVGHLSSQPSSSVVLISSAAAHIGLSNHEAIAACKAGIEGLVRSAATTYAAQGVRINAVAPGLVRTPMTERIWSQPKSAEASRSMHPIGRLGEPEDIARAILWLASVEQSWVTGQVLGVDGGLGTLKSLTRP